MKIKIGGERLTLDEFDNDVYRALRNLTRGRYDNDATAYQVARWMYSRPQYRTVDRIAESLTRLCRARRVRARHGRIALGLVYYTPVRVTR